MLSQILFVLGAASAVIGFGFLIGLSQNITIDNELARQAAYNYDSNIIFGKLIISDDKTAALTLSNKGILLFKAIGSRVSVRIISKNNIEKHGEVIFFALHDLGFPDFKTRFHNNNVETLFEEPNLGGAANA